MLSIHRPFANAPSTRPWLRCPGAPVSGLYTVGETACTGLHGANRLASNSLLEGLVMAHRACEALLREQPTSHAARAIALPEGFERDVMRAVGVAVHRARLQLRAGGLGRAK